MVTAKVVEVRLGEDDHVEVVLDRPEGSESFTDRPIRLTVVGDRSKALEWYRKRIGKMIRLSPEDT